VRLLLKAVQDEELRSTAAEADEAYVDWEALRPRMPFREAVNSAERFLPLLNGMLRMWFSAFQELTLQAVRGVRDNGEPIQFAWDDVVIATAEAGQQAEEYLRDGGPTLGRVYRLARESAALAEALLYFGRRTEPFFNQHKAYEVVVQSIGADGIAKLGVPNNARERFARSANDPQISGVFARHSKRFSDVPANPMSEHEARQFIADVLHHWSLALAPQ
jgi:hypothetical protein